MTEQLFCDTPYTHLDFFNPQELFFINKRGVLPHLEQRGKLYFVTFRLRDALPANVLDNIQAQLKQSSESNDSASDIYWIREYHRKLTATLDKYIDKGYGDCILSLPEVRKAIVKTFIEHQHDDYIIYDYVIMPNHIHMIIKPAHWLSLKEVMASLKRKSAVRINKLLNKTGSIWQREYYDIIVRSWSNLQQFKEYIKSNPEELPDDSFLLVTSVFD